MRGKQSVKKGFNTNSTGFIVRYERVRRKNLPSNVTIRQTRPIGPRNTWIRKKKERFAPSTTKRVAKIVVRIYKNQGKRRKAQTGGSKLENLAKLGIKMGLKAINSGLEKKKLNEGIKHAPDLYKYETSKIRNKKVQKALNSDIENYIVTETRNKVKDNSNNLFGGI